MRYLILKAISRILAFDGFFSIFYLAFVKEKKSIRNKKIKKKLRKRIEGRIEKEIKQLYINNFLPLLGSQHL